MNVFTQCVTDLHGYVSHRGVAAAKKPTEPAALIIRLADSSNTLILLKFLINSILFFE